ncbi:MAG: ATP-binding protein, partial [Anaerolineales bacterium]
EVGRGHLDYRVKVESRDEVGLLASAFNNMAVARQRAESEQESAYAELEAFSYSVSHDLRAPLRAMDGFARILIEEHASQLSREAGRYLGLVQSNAKKMGMLIDDLLAFSRLGRQPLRARSVSPDEIVSSAIEDLHAEREGRKVTIAVQDLPECLADQTLLKQVFVNLLDNALKFTRQREEASIEVGFQAPVDGRRDGAYFVKDNGVGFDMQYADKLFGVFQRLHREEDFEGTGVGLATVQRIIHRHGGRVWAEAEVDHGAAFYFNLGGEDHHD